MYKSVKPIILKDGRILIGKNLVKAIKAVADHWRYAAHQDYKKHGDYFKLTIDLQNANLIRSGKFMNDEVMNLLYHYTVTNTPEPQRNLQ